MERLLPIVLLAALSASPARAADAPFRAAPDVVLPAGAYPSALAFGDLDSDGRRDLVVADFAGNRVVPRLGNGDGTFRAGASLPPFLRPTAVGLADLDGDGREDLAVAAGSSKGPRIFLARGTGDGGFELRQAIDPPGDDPVSSLAVGDFNGDGRADLVLGTVHGAFVRLGGPDFAFAGGADLPLTPTQTVEGVVVGDFFGQALDSVAVSLRDSDDASGALGLYQGAGDGTFGPQRRIPLPGPGSVPVVGDFDTDARLDLAASIYDDDRVAVRLNRGGGAFRLPPPDVLVGDGPGIVLPVDVDRDGREDLVTAEAAKQLSVRLGDGRGGFGDGGTLPTDAQPRRAATADVNGDGTQDLVFSSADNLVRVRLGTTPAPAGDRIVNGGFEAGLPGRVPAERPPVPGWTASGLTSRRYGSTPVLTVPSWADAGRWSSGRSFLAGGADGATEAHQDVDVSDQARAIDAGRVTMTLSARLGGARTRSDAMTVRAEPGGIALGPVTAADRRGLTTLLARSASAPVPAGTRRVRVTVASTGATAMADDVRLVLRVRPADPAPRPTPTATPRPQGRSGGDQKAPRVARVRVTRGTRLRFTLSEAARVRVRVFRRSRVVRTVRRAGRPGANRVRLGHLRHGRYRLTVRATDAAGNSTTTKPRRFTRRAKG